jgi:hypothetical protein
MKNALTVFHRSLYDTYQHLTTILWSTILWWLSALPIVTLGPATVGLFHVLKQKKSGKSVRPSDFWYGMRKGFGVSIRLTLLYLLVSVPGLLYFFILLGFNTFLSYFIAIILLYFLVMWHLLYLYIVPLIIEQEETKLSILFKRALRLVSENYMLTINITLYMVIITLICSIISILLVIWAGWMAMTAYNSLLYLLNKHDPTNYGFDPTVKWRNQWKTWK